MREGGFAVNLMFGWACGVRKGVEALDKFLDGAGTGSEPHIHSTGLKLSGMHTSFQDHIAHRFR
ncbi:MAG: hypothetical protein J0H19_18200 [Rhodospirillales bacterium]|nr:hypothetical protein [Rhodospirillales bacterium]